MSLYTMKYVTIITFIMYYYKENTNRNIIFMLIYNKYKMRNSLSEIWKRSSHCSQLCIRLVEKIFF